MTLEKRQAALNSVSINDGLLNQDEVDQLIHSGHSIRKHSSRVPKTGRHGDQLSKQLGDGFDFAESNTYQINDNPRHIDWRASARSQTLRVKRYHQELANPVFVVLDRNSSMCFGTKTRLKIAQAARCALLIAGRCLYSEHNLGACIIDDANTWFSPTATNKLLNRFTDCAIAPANTYATNQATHKKIDWRHIFSDIHLRLSKGSSVIFISDFADLDSFTMQGLSSIGQHYNCSAIHIADVLELGIPSSSILSLHYGKDNTVVNNKYDVGDINTQLMARQKNIEKLCLRANIHYTLLNADKDEISTLVSEITL